MVGQTEHRGENGDRVALELDERDVRGADGERGLDDLLGGAQRVVALHVLELEEEVDGVEEGRHEQRVAGQVELEESVRVRHNARHYFAAVVVVVLIGWWQWLRRGGRGGGGETELDERVEASQVVGQHVLVALDRGEYLAEGAVGLRLAEHIVLVVRDGRLEEPVADQVQNAVHVRSIAPVGAVDETRWLMMTRW